MRLWSCVLVVGISISLPRASAAIAPTTSAIAAIPADQLITAANGQIAQCMARTTTQTENANFQFVIPVPSSKTAEFAAKGFTPAACNGLARDLVHHKARTCDLARGNDDVQRRTEQVLGIDARKMCVAAKVLVPDTPADPATGN